MIEVIETPPQTYTRKRRMHLMGTDVHSSDYALQKLRQEFRGFEGGTPAYETGGTIAFSKLVFVNEGKSNEYVTSNDAVVKQHFKNLQALLGVGVDGKIGYGTMNAAFRAINSIPANSASIRHAEYWPMIEYTQGKSKVPGVIAIQADRVARVLRAGASAQPPVADDDGDEPPVHDQPPVEDKKDKDPAPAMAWYKTTMGMAGIGLIGIAAMYLLLRKKPDPGYNQLTP